MNMNFITGSGKIGNKTIQLKPLQTLVVDGSVKVEVRYGKDTQAAITADDNIIDLILVEQVGDTLKIGIKSNCSFSTKLPMRVTLSLPESLKEIYLQGSGSINTTGYTGVVLSTVELTGSGDILIEEMNTIDLSVILDGSGSICFKKGIVENLHASICGPGKIITEVMFSNNAVVNLAGSGTAKINVRKTVRSIITGSGNIKIIGNAEAVGEKITGSGKLQYN